MKKIYLSLIALLVSWSCQKDGATPIDAETIDPYWMKLGIPKELRMGAIYGDIDDTLVVATTDLIYYSVDKGQSWVQSYKGTAHFSGFTSVKDTILAFDGFTNDGLASDPWSFNYYAIMPYLFSVDHGQTWTNYSNPNRQAIIRKRDEVALSNQISYRINYNFSPLNSQHTSFLEGLNEIVRRDLERQSTRTVYFPFKRKLEYLHLDGKGRLYVGAHGFRLMENNEADASFSDSALLYISKVPVEDLPTY